MPTRPSTAATSREEARPLSKARTVLRLGLTCLGIVGGATVLSMLWPKPDPGSQTGGIRRISDLAKPPNRSVTVLVIGVDADRLSDGSNKAAPAGPANADALFLIRVNPDGPLQVLGLPSTLAVKVPGQSKPQSLGSLYRLGGVALTSDAVRGLVDLAPGQPDRYAVLSRGALRDLADELGSVEVNPVGTMRYRDRRQDLNIDLQGGLQRLDGRQLEHLARYRDPRRPVESRLSNHQEVIRGLLQELSPSSRVDALPDLVRTLKGEVQTNLTPAEILSLMAGGIKDTPPVQFSTLPLAPPRGKQQSAPGALREMSRSAPDPLWPQPPPVEMAESEAADSP